MISIVACCHGAKHCAYAARDFRSQHYEYTLFVTHTSVRKGGALCHSPLWP